MRSYGSKMAPLAQETGPPSLHAIQTQYITPGTPHPHHLS